MERRENLPRMGVEEPIGLAAFVGNGDLHWATGSSATQLGGLCHCRGSRHSTQSNNLQVVRRLLSVF